MDPFFKWAGGKKRMIKKYEALNLLPKAPSTVIEPFCGGAAMSLHLQPKSILLNDTAYPVADFWSCVSVDPMRLIDTCKDLYEKEIKNIPVEYSYNHCKQILNGYLFLVKERQLYSDEMFMFASTFLFINKHCFNGLWRVNRQGQYNVPYGKYRTLNQWIPKLSELLKLQDKIEIVDCVDYEDFMQGFEIEDSDTSFLFVDPPYYDKYAGYGTNAFGKEDHKHLRSVVESYDIRYIAVANIDCTEVRDIWKGWNIHTIPSKTTIQGQGSSAQNELLITNY